jgi:hypothetical protein
VLRAIGLGLALLLAGPSACSGPYSNPPEKLKKPRQQAEPEVTDPGKVEIKFVEDCPVKFQEPNDTGLKTHRAGKKAAMMKVQQADELLQKAQAASDDKTRAAQTVEAISTLRKALVEAPYLADATYLLAHAYARTRRKGCAINVLKRLAELQKYNEFAADAKRKVDEAESDPAFSLFRKDANGAINR